MTTPPKRNPAPGAIVSYTHPDWGRCRGKVLDAPPARGTVLVQDLADGGGREWWPVAGLVEAAPLPARECAL